MSDDITRAMFMQDRRGALALSARMLALAGAASWGASGVPAAAAVAAAAPDVVRDGPLVMRLMAITLPGSQNAQNADFILKSIAGGLMGVSTDLMPRLVAQLAQAAGGDFLALPPARQIEVLTALDAKTFAPGAAPTGAWYSMRALILMAYYTSEDGMSKDLRYELIPGHYDSDIVIDAAWRPLSNDWWATTIREGIVG